MTARIDQDIIIGGYDIEFNSGWVDHEGTPIPDSPLNCRFPIRIHGSEELAFETADTAVKKLRGQLAKAIKTELKALDRVEKSGEEGMIPHIQYSLQRLCRQQETIGIKPYPLFSEDLENEETN